VLEGAQARSLKHNDCQHGKTQKAFTNWYKLNKS